MKITRFNRKRDLNFDTAYDFWQPDSGLIATDNVLTPCGDAA